MEFTKEELAIRELMRLNYELQYNNDILLKNQAVLDVTESNNDDDSLLPNGLYNHLFHINSLLMDRSRELQHMITDKMKKIGRPILVDTQCKTYKTFPNSIQFQILLPESFTYSTDCRTELDAAINDTVIPIIKKYITIPKEGE